MRRTLLTIGSLVSAACAGSPSPGSAAPPAAAPAAQPASTVPDSDETADEIAGTFDELRPRLHAIYRGRLDHELDTIGRYCASELEGIDPPGARGPARLCTPVDEVIGWHGQRAVPVPTGSPRWIATTRDEAGHERIAAATVADPTASSLTDEAKRFLTEQYGCGQLELRWRIPAASQVCVRDADCRLFESTCFAAAVAATHAAPYEALFRRSGGTCIDPAGGMCPPAPGVACIEQRCAVNW